MSSAFTEYIRALDPGGEPPSRECFDAFWNFLRDTLVSEMRKRGLWRSSPRYLGIYARSGWSEGDALEELLVDCYAFIISRLRGLKAQLERKSDIRGLLFLNVRNFLYDTQKKHDPLGFRIFTLLRAAMREALAEKSLHVVEGDPRVRNDTVLAFTAEGDRSEVAEGANLSDHVRGWSDDLLPDLVIAFGRGLVRARANLKAHVLALGDQGFEAFRFEDVVGPLKRETRARWSAIWQQAQGEMAVEDDEGELVTFVPSVQPDTGVEERESFRKLLACVDEAIERLDPPRAARLELHRLWRYLRCHAAESSAASTSSPADRRPSRRKTARLLGISRNRLADLLATLGRLVEECRADTFGKTAVKEKGERLPPAGGGTETS